MSEGIRIEIEAPDTEAMVQKVRTAVYHQMQIHAERMKAYASSYVPVRTGRLQQSITAETSQDEDTVTITMGANARSSSKGRSGGEMYGPFVEYGTGQRGEASGKSYKGHANEDLSYNASWPGMDAKPFIRPAVYDLEDVLRRDLARAIGKALE